MKAGKIIALVFTIILLIVGSVLIYSAVNDILTDNVETPIEIIVEPIVEEDTNSCPIIENIDDSSLTVGDKITILAYATDENGDSLEYTFSNIAESEVDKNKFEWTPLEDQDGEYSLTVTVSDGSCEDSTSFTLYVDEDEDDNDDEDDEPQTQDLPDFEYDSLLTEGLNEDLTSLSFDLKIANVGLADHSGAIELQAQVTITDGTFSATFGPQTETLQDILKDESKLQSFVIETPGLEGNLTGNEEITIEISIDRSNLIEEEDETNNEETFTFTQYFQPSETTLPDFTAQNIELISFNEATETISFTAEITNQGNENYNGDFPIFTQITLMDENSNLVYNYAIDTLTISLDAGEITQSTFNIVVANASDLKGQIEVWTDVSVDYGNTIEETEEFNNVATLTQTIDESYFQTILDCGEDFACFIEAAEYCGPVTTTYTQTIDIFGFLETAVSQLSVEGYDNNDNCIFTLTYLDFFMEFTQNLIDQLLNAGLTEEEIEQQRQESEQLLQDTFIGETGTCYIHPADLNDLLDRWNQGQYSTEDFDGFTCTGILEQ